MAEREKLVGKASEFKDGDRRIVFLGNTESRDVPGQGRILRLQQLLPPPGRTACEGLIIAKVEERHHARSRRRAGSISPKRSALRLPWHGYEYDMKTGECVSDRKLKLRKYQGRAARRRSLCRRLGLARGRRPQDRTAKRAPKAAAVKPSNQPPACGPVAEAGTISNAALRLAADVERGLAAGSIDMLTPEAVQALMAAACNVYSAQVEAGQQYVPIKPQGVTPTAVMTAASGILRSANLAVFELGMWQSWTDGSPAALQLRRRNPWTSFPIAAGGFRSTNSTPPGSWRTRASRRTSASSTTS